MKIKMIMLFLMLISAAVYAQHDHGAGQNSAPAHSKKENDVHSHRAAPVFQKQLADVFTASLQLKEALISSDSMTASASIQEIKNSLSKVDMTLLKDESLMDWMSNLKVFNESMTLISSSTNLKVQRKAFTSFSDALYKSAKLFGLGSMTTYYTYCPMANNNIGAFWLSESKQIRNPYMGEQMLTCGKVKETLQ
jgi:Cu(I)/Ag(I) efflux system membrane fusion protein